MLVFLSIVISIYGAMHFYAFSKVWQLIPHSTAWVWTLILVGLADVVAVAALANYPVKLDTRKALASVTKNDFIILFKQQPEVDNEAPFDLQLSGDVHGGQIFPFGFLKFMVYGVRTGLTQLADGHLLYVSRGTGT